MITIKKCQPYLMLLGIYLVANSWLLLNINGVYFDDWTIFNHDYATLLNFLNQLQGGPGFLFSVIHQKLGDFSNGVVGYRLLIAFLYYGCGLFVYKILYSMKCFSKVDALYLSIFFLVAPVFLGRLYLSVIQYTVFLFVFFFAFFLLSKYIKFPRIWLRIIILSLFFLSFFVNSLLVFYAVPIIYLLYVSLSVKDSSWSERVRVFLMKKIDFILLPIVFFVIKILYWTPYGIYAEYNSISLIKLFLAPFGVISQLYFSFTLPIIESLSLVGFFIPFLMLYVLIIEKNTTNYFVKIRESYWFFLIGVLMFSLAVFPYLAVGKFPADGWGSRHQLLVPLGFAFMLYYFINIFVDKFGLSRLSRSLILNGLIAAFVTQGVYQGYLYKKDWIYQSAIIENFKTMEVVKENTTFVIHKEVHNVFVSNRMMYDYEYSGMLREAFGNDKRYATNSLKELNSHKDKNGIVNLRIRKELNASNWKYTDPIYLNISLGYNPNSNYTLKRMFYLMFLELFNKTKFNAEVVNLVTIKQVLKTNFQEYKRLEVAKKI